MKKTTRKAPTKKKTTKTKPTSRATQKKAVATRPIRSQPLIAVRDVKKSSRWYAKLLGTKTMPPHPHREVYDRILSGGQLVLQLHAWDEENHPNLVDAGKAPPGHGVVLWFELDDFDAAVARARSLRAVVLEEPHVNPAPRHREMWLRDLDGFVVVIASPDGEAKGR